MMIKFFMKGASLDLPFSFCPRNLLLRIVPSNLAFPSFKALRSLRRIFSIFAPRTNSDEPLGEQLVAERFD